MTNLFDVVEIARRPNAQFPRVISYIPSDEARVAVYPGPEDDPNQYDLLFNRTLKSLVLVPTGLGEESTRAIALTIFSDNAEGEQTLSSPSKRAAFGFFSNQTNDWKTTTELIFWAVQREELRIKGASDGTEMPQLEFGDPAHT